MNRRILTLALFILIVIAVWYYLDMPLEETVAPALPDQPGFPTASGEVIEHTYYTLCYNEAYEQPDWVMYKLTDESLSQGKHARKDNFRADSLVSTSSASLADYRRSGYDRGHLVPAADMKFSAQAMSETFYMSNMSPQAPGFNRGIWKKLEEQVRDWAEENSELYIITGPVLQGELPTIGKNEVAVPRYYYKIILDYAEPEFKAIAFVMENKKLEAPLMHYAVTIDSVESLTGFDFFSDLPDDFEDRLEGAFDLAGWVSQNKK